MKKIILGLSLVIFGTLTYAQNGLENIIVEKYYISNAADAAGSIGVLPTGSTTYRIYADMLPGYKFQAIYGVAGHQFLLKTSTTFFNNEDRGATTPTFSKSQAADNTVMLDSWFSAGAACTGNFGILKSEDNGVANVVNANGILQNNNPSAGIPLTTQDGIYAGTPQAVTFVGLTTELDVFDATSQFGNTFSTYNGSVASLNGSTGPIPATNKVLIAQMTTDGCFSFELNLQIGTPSGGIENYVARDPIGSEILLPGLTYNRPSVTISANPAGAVICAGSSVTFTATPVNGGSTPSFTWKKNGVTVGGNSSTYTTTGLANNDQIYCKMTSNATGLCLTGQVSSDTIYAAVSPIPTATITPTGPTTFCSGTNALTLTATAGTGYTYKWYKGTAVITGATGITYNPTSTNTYKVRVTTSNGCSKTSSAVSATVNSLPTATVTTTGPTTFCSGTNLLTLTANSGSGLTYQWRKGTTDVSGATNISYIPTSSSTYKVIVTNTNGCTKSSSGVVVTVKSLPAATITAQGPTTFCAGDSVILAANSGTGYSYQWTKSNVNISGATSINYTAKVAGTYKVKVTNTNSCSKTSSSKTVTINCKDGELLVGSSENQLLVFPNPSNGPITLKFSDETIEDGNAKVELVTLLGQPVISFLTEIVNGQFEQQINTEKMSKGVYFIKVSLHDITYDSKLIIQ